MTANQKAHHTDEYDVSELILRRGQDFLLTISLDQPFDSKKDELKLQFVTGAWIEGVIYSNVLIQYGSVQIGSDL